MKPEPWQQLVIDTLKELSDESFQERAWVRGEGDGISSPLETVNQLFDDSGLGDLLVAGGAFSDGADMALRKLGNLVDAIDFERPIEDLLADSNWLKLRLLAAQAMHEVKKSIDEN